MTQYKRGLVLRIACTCGDGFRNHTLVERMTGTTGYHLSTVGRGVSDWWKIRCHDCQRVSIGDLGSD
jgi:hypothetical protein